MVNLPLTASFYKTLESIGENAPGLSIINGGYPEILMVGGKKSRKKRVGKRSKKRGGKRSKKRGGKRSKRRYKKLKIKSKKLSKRCTTCP